MSRASPTPFSAYKKVIELPTRWADNDIYGHVNNVAYYSYFDTAVNKILIGEGLLDIQSGDIIGLVVETGCRYFKSLAYPDDLRVGVGVERLGNSSVTYKLCIVSSGDDTIAAEGRFTHVYVDRETRRPTPLPDEWREVLTRFVFGSEIVLDKD